MANEFIAKKGLIAETGGITETGGVLKQNLLTNSGFGVWSNSTLENVGSDLSTNGDMELDSNWNSYNTPTTNERSTTQVNGGTYSRKVVTDGSDEGIECDTTFTVTAGKLYKLQAYIYNTNAARGFLIGRKLGGGTGVIDPTNSGYDTVGQNSWTAISFVAEATTGGTITPIIVALDGTTTFYIDDVTIYEVTPGCVAANQLSPDTWLKRASTTVKLYREHDGSNTKDGSFYSLKVINTDGAERAAVQWPKSIDAEDFFLKKVIGRTMTFGAWVKSGSANDIRLSFIESGSAAQFSSYNTGTSWEWLEITRTISASITSFMVSFRTVDSSTAYISQPILVFGNSIGEGNYTPIPQEVVMIEKVGLNITDTATPAASDDRILNVEAQSNLRLPKNINALYVNLQVRATAVADAEGVYLGNTSSANDIGCIPPVANIRVRNSGRVRTDSNGDIYQAISTSGNVIDRYYIYVTAVELR